MNMKEIFLNESIIHKSVFVKVCFFHIYIYIYIYIVPFRVFFGFFCTRKVNEVDEKFRVEPFFHIVIVRPKIFCFLEELKKHLGFYFRKLLRNLIDQMFQSLIAIIIPYFTQNWKQIKHLLYLLKSFINYSPLFNYLQQEDSKIQHRTSSRL